MKRVGRVLHLTPGGMLIIRAEKTPNIGDEVVDKRLRKVGVVFDIFGPTASPYVSVKPSVADPTSLLGEVLYSTSKREGRRWRGRGT